MIFLLEKGCRKYFQQELFINMQYSILVTIALVFFISATVYSFSGFGYALIAIPLLTMILSPGMAIPLSVFLGVFMSSWLLYSTRREVEFREISYLIIGMIPGVPIGTYFLAHLDPGVIILTANCLVIVSVFLFLIEKKGFRSVIASRATDIIAGFLSGLLGSSCGISGPPVILLAIVKNWNKDRFRANLMWYFAIWGVFSLMSYFAIGLIKNKAFIQLFIFGMAGLSLGVFIGSRLSRIATQDFFSKACIILILLFAFISIGKNIFMA